MKKLLKPIIMIDGLLGCGKTILAKYLADATNSTAIHGDVLMADSAMNNSDKLFERFGTTPAEQGGLREFVHKIAINVKAAYDFMECVRPGVEELVVQIIKELENGNQHKVNPNSIYNYSGNSNAYIVEFITSSAFKELWNTANERYVIIALLEKILANSKARGRSDDAFETTINKFDARMPIVMRAKNVDYTIINQHDNVDLFIKSAGRVIIPQIKKTMRQRHS